MSNESDDGVGARVMAFLDHSRMENAGRYAKAGRSLAALPDGEVIAAYVRGIDLWAADPNLSDRRAWMMPRLSCS